METNNFEFQKWPVYREAKVFAIAAQKFCLKLPRSGTQALGDQFRRASQSIVLNIAEGSARTTAKDKINFLRIAKGSVFECAAISDLAADFGLLDGPEHEDYQAKLANIGRMLSGMIRYWEKAPERKPSENHQTGYAG